MERATEEGGGEHEGKEVRREECCEEAGREESEQVKILTSKKASKDGHQEKVLIGRKEWEVLLLSV